MSKKLNDSFLLILVFNSIFFIEVKDSYLKESINY